MNDEYIDELRAKYNKATSELSALREENERLKEESEKRRVVLKKVLTAWEISHEDDYKYDDDREDCGRCGGFGHIEQGGDAVECTRCEGEGMEPLEKVLNIETFSEKIVSIMFDSDDYFFELIGEKIETDTPPF